MKTFLKTFICYLMISTQIGPAFAMSYDAERYSQRAVTLSPEYQSIVKSMGQKIESRFNALSLEAQNRFLTHISNRLARNIRRVTRISDRAWAKRMNILLRYVPEGGDLDFADAYSRVRDGFSVEESQVFEGLVAPSSMSEPAVSASEQFSLATTTLGDRSSVLNMLENLKTKIDTKLAHNSQLAENGQVPFPHAMSIDWEEISGDLVLVLIIGLIVTGIVLLCLGGVVGGLLFIIAGLSIIVGIVIIIAIRIGGTEVGLSENVL